MNRRSHFLFAIVLMLAACPLVADEFRLTVSYDGSRRELTTTELGQLPSVEVDADDHGRQRRYRGVPVREILALVDAPFGDRLRGRATALAVRVRAADGYVAAFALAEFDPAFRERDILLADRQDGEPLPASAGPWRFVCPGDKRGARSIRQVVSIEVFSLAEIAATPR